MTRDGPTRAVCALLLLCALGAAFAPPPARAVSQSAPPPRAAWAWPIDGARLVGAFVAPVHDYGPGHRGIDLISPVEPAAVRAPADGFVAFAGTVADRGVVTIDHGEGVVSTLEPVRPLVIAGERVHRGEVVGELSAGGHAPPGSLHVGARVDGAYVNPLLFLGGAPRAVLLPCC